MSKYLLDANVFIQASRFHYPFDVFPGFWDWLARDLRNGSIASIEPIYQEISAGNDELKIWVEKLKKDGCFLKIDDKDTQEKFTEIANWVMDSNRPFKDYAREEFLSVADPWLIAKANSIEAIIVTHETFRPDIKRKIQIPNVCRAFGIKYINTIDLIREKKVKFKLG